MSTADVADRVRKLLAEHLGVDLEKVVDGASLHDDLGADSLDDVEIIMACEEEFDVEIPDDDLMTASTVGDVIKLVGRLQL